MKFETNLSLTSRLAEALESVHIAQDGLSASVLGQLVSGDDVRETEHQLSQAIYARFHAGLDPARLKNDTQRRGDPDVEAMISEATPVKTRTILCPKFEDASALGIDDGYIATIDGVSVHVPSVRVVRTDERGLVVSRPSLNYRLSVGFTFYVSQVGPGRGGDLLRLYRWSSRPEELARPWHDVIEYAEAKGLALRAKMLSERDSYPRNDSMVVYVPAESFAHAHALADLMRTRNSLARTSLFARDHGGGVSSAWEPLDPTPYRRHLSFGEHRSGQVAHGLFRAHSEGIDKLEAVRAALLSGNIDPTEPARNLTSPRVPL